MYQFEGFDNARVSYETFLKVAEPWDFPQWTGAVKGWLLGKPGQYLRLEDDYDLDHYRLAAYTSGLDWTQDWKRFARATIEFSCKPYRYLKSGEEQVSAQAGESLWDYARRYEKTMEEMIAANPHIRDIAVLEVGEEVRVP